MAFFLSVWIIGAPLIIAQVTRDQVTNAWDPTEQDALIRKISALPAESRKESVLLIEKMINEELTSGHEYNEGNRLIWILGRVGDDATLARVLAPCLDNPDDRVRGATLDVLRKQSGPEVRK